MQKKWCKCSKLLISVLALLLIVSFLLSACAKTTSTTTQTSSTQTTLTPQYGGTLKMLVSALPAQIGHPAEVGKAYNQFMMWCQPVFERLFYRSVDGRPLPALVQSWEISTDGKTLTWHLKQGVKFHDGTDFDAAAVKYNLEEQAKTPTGKAPLSKIVEINAIEKYTVQVKLSVFDAALMSYTLAGYLGYIASPTAMQKPATPETIGLHMVGTGPFKFAEFQRDVLLRFERWDGYYETGKPYLDAIEVVSIADPITRLMAFQSGDGQFINQVTAKDASELRSLGFNIVKNESYIMFCYYPDSANPDSPWSNVKVRQAAQYAINTKEIAQNIMGGEGYEGLSQYAASVDAWYNQGLFREYDPQKARDLLESAGYSTGFDTTIYTTGPLADYVVAMQNYLNAVGIRAEIKVLDFPTLSTYWLNGWENGIVWQPTTSSISSFVNYFSDIPKTAYFPSMVRPAGMQAMLDAASSEIDDSKRAEMMKGIVKAIYDEALVLPIYAFWELQGQSPTLHDLAWGKNFATYDEPQNAWLESK